MKKLLSIALSILMGASLVGCSNGTSGTESSGKYTDGTYTASAKGMNGEVPVTVVVENGNIKSVEVGENTETDGIGTNAISEVPGKIVEANSPDVDTTSGATVTSNAIIKAVKIALGLEEAEKTSSTNYEVTESDIIVVGGGLTGLVAAARSADLGAKVILFEQSDILGGNSRYAGGYISGAKTEIQEKYGIEDSYELAYEDLVRLGGIENLKPALTWEHVQRAGEMVNWVTDTLGVKLSEPGHGAYTPTNVARVYITENGGQEYVDALTAYLQKYIENKDVTIYMNSNVDGLLTEDDTVTGVTVGNTTFKASKVILATGGYAYNEEWINKYNFKHARSQSPATSTGSGYDLAESVGASFSNMDYMPAYPGAVDINDDSFTASVVADASGWSGSIWVDKNGKRLFNETGFTTSERQQAWENAEDNYVYMVFTQEMKDEAETPVLNVDQKSGNWDKFDELLKNNDGVFSGSSIDEVATAAGVDAEGLEAEIEKYNGYVDAGKDADFGRADKLEKFADDTTYYIIRTVPYVLLSKGGVDINTKAQVLRADGSVINGLFAGGELIGGANIGGHASHGGLACVSTFVWGTIAAENAVSEIKGEEVHVEGYTPVSTEIPEVK